VRSDEKDFALAGCVWVMPVASKEIIESLFELLSPSWNVNMRNRRWYGTHRLDA